MIIKDMFEKDIDRPIRGVIKADQTSEDDIFQELEEYVVTRELHRHFSKFYENYIRGIDSKTDKVGVWISGFFGSGKSHFLKILSYLLENKQVKGKSPVSFFEDKIQDQLIYANMQKVANIPTETILFNIDSKSPLGNKAKEDAILRVLLKVFNEHRGYYGDNPAVAELEKYLDDNGFFEDFKREFKKVANEPWEKRRNSFYFDSNYVKTALLNSTNMEAEAVDHWLQHGVDNVDISIEKFANEVKEYIDKQEDPNFRLVFLIDEVGQYIGDRRDLMLNLQTVTENLGAICEGRAWIIVTSQESIDSIVKVKGDDFSRIQGRFDTRLSLSSISVDEVIQKRVLEKKDFAADTLKSVHAEKGPILRNVINFTSDSRADLLGYSDETEFANVYPFVPYQFNLLQSVFEQVRKHGSSGKHLSEGERSMLSAYREAGMRFMTKEQGTLIPFYAFYDTISEFLQPTVSRVIERATDNPKLKDDPFHVNLLKVLFMIKYVEEIPSNIDNLATLMVSHIDEDKLELKEKINASLRKLRSQTLIQKHGEHYIFLTDDEQDINREIDQVSIEEDAVKRELADYIFNDLYHVNRYSYSNVYEFSFNRKMDEKNYGNQNSSMGINILSPLSERYHNAEQDLMMFTSGSNDVVIHLGGDGSYVEEIEEALKIDEYRRRRNINQLPENIQNIINNKGVEVRERRRRTKDLLETAIKECSIFINGNVVHVTGSTVREKINNAFKLLVENIYSRLSDVTSFVHKESDLRTLLTADTDQITLGDQELGSANQLAKDEIASFISLQHEMNNQVTVKTIYDRFTSPPFGWRQLDIASIISELLMEQNIRIRYEAKYLEPKEDVDSLMTVFTKPIEAGRGVVLIRKKVDSRLMNTVRRLAQDLFNKRDIASDEDGLVRDIRTLMTEKENEIKIYLEKYSQRAYPGRAILDRGLEHFSQFNEGIDNLTFFTKMAELEDDLLDWAEIYDDYIVSFFNTDQKRIYDEGLDAMEKYEDVKGYIQDEQVIEAMEELNKIQNYTEPFRKISEIPELINTFNEHLKELLREKREKTKEKIESDYGEVSLHAKQYGVSNETKVRVDQQFERLLSNLEEHTDIYRIDAAITHSTSHKERFMREITAEIKAWQKQKEREAKERQDQQIGDPTEPIVIEPEPTVETQEVNISNLVDIERLSSEEDVDQYVDLLRIKLKEIIRSNKEVKLIE